MRSGQASLARALASERTRLRPSSPGAWVAAARAFEVGGEAAHAAGARRQAARLCERFREGRSARGAARPAAAGGALP